MIFHENRLLADDSHVTFFPKLETMSQLLSSAAVVTGALGLSRRSIWNLFGVHLYTVLLTNVSAPLLLTYVTVQYTCIPRPDLMFIFKYIVQWSCFVRLYRLGENCSNI